MNTLKTKVAIAGGGPAGIMLGFLLAKAGIDVAVFEKWPDFFRDFRGDTIHPSTMEVLKELGLLEKFLKLPHDETKKIALHIGGEELLVADFSHLKVACPFVGFIPQWDFLNFIRDEAYKYPHFHLYMETEVTDLIKEGNKIIGVKAQGKNGEFEVHSELVVGADGRHSVIREKAGFQIIDYGAPIDVLWFRLPRKDDHSKQSLGYVDNGRMMVLLDRSTYWQCAFIIRKGQFEEIKQKGLEEFKKSIADFVPLLKDSTHEIQSWDQIKLLSVAVDHLEKWYTDGLICIGDSAHAMSPVGGVGINLAIQDAVASANVLIPAFKNGALKIDDLKAIQERRSRPSRMTQKLQVFIHKHVIEKVLGSKKIISLPWQLKMLRMFPVLTRIPAKVIGIGFRAEHIKDINE